MKQGQVVIKPEIFQLWKEQVTESVKNRNDFYWKWIEQPKRRLIHFVHTLLGWDTKKQIQIEVDKHRYEIVYQSPTDIMMLLGWVEEEEDYYYVLWDYKEGIILSSCCMGFIFLKDRLTRFEYANSEYVWHLNNPPLKEILKKCQKKKIKLR